MRGAPCNADLDNLQSVSGLTGNALTFLGSPAMERAGIYGRKKETVGTNMEDEI